MTDDEIYRLYAITYAKLKTGDLVTPFEAARK